MTSFSVLVVCTANLCRSPMIEAILRARVDVLALPWAISSAGTRAHGDQPMHPRTESVLVARGLGAPQWRSRRLTAELAGEADLIITAETEHRSVVTQLAPHAATHVFPLLQLSRICEHIAPISPVYPARAGDDLLARIAVARTAIQPAAPGGDDLADPIGRRDRIFRACAQQVDAALDKILRPLAA